VRVLNIWAISANFNFFHISLTYAAVKNWQWVSWGLYILKPISQTKTKSSWIPPFTPTCKN